MQLQNYFYENPFTSLYTKFLCYKKLELYDIYMLNKNSLGLLKKGAAKWIGKTKNWYQAVAKCICKNKDRFQVADSWIRKIQGHQEGGQGGT